MVRSEASVQNSAPVDVSQELQDSLGVLHQGGQGRPLVPVAHTPSLAPHLLPVTTIRTISVLAHLSQNQSAPGQLERSLLCKRLLYPCMGIFCAFTARVRLENCS